jgi:CRP-like cAMP-binding protein
VDGGVHQQIDLLLSREEIAGMVGTATESVIRLLSEFNKDGLSLMARKLELKTRKDWSDFRIFMRSQN